MIFNVSSGTTPVFTANLVDADGAAIALSSLGTLTLTLFNKDTRAVINSRDRQNVLNANNVVVSAVGLVTWSIQAADLIVPSGSVEAILVGVFEWAWSSGTKAGWHPFSLKVTAVPRP